MATWTSISNAAVAVGGIPSSTTVTALRDNPSALAESSSGAPVMVSGWHPHDKVTIGDGKTGLIYDFAVNGVQSSVVTPDFVDGYEYRVVADSLSHNDTTSSRQLRIGLTIDGTNYSDGGIITDDNGADFNVDAEILTPRITKSRYLIRLSGAANNSFSSTSGLVLDPAGSGKILRARLIFSSGSIDQGKIWFFRRREYASLP